MLFNANEQTRVPVTNIPHRMGIDESWYKEFPSSQRSYVDVYVAFLRQGVLKPMLRNILHYPVDITRWSDREQAAW